MYDHPTAQALGESYDMLVLHLSPLASVYRSLKLEVTKAIQFDHGRGMTTGGSGQQDDDGDDDEDEFTNTRFVEGELLDSSVYGIQPEHVVHQSGADLMATTFSLLECAAANREEEDGETVYEAISSDLETDEISLLSNLESMLEKIHAHDIKQLYRDLSRECATMLGDMWLVPR